MATIPEPQNTIASLIDEAHESRQEPPRPHLGCSMLGHPCDRYLWINFRWAVIEKFPGRILRLFRRGQNEELPIVQDLRAIGMDVQDTGAGQSRVDFGAHVSGSIDGVIKTGFPGHPNKPHILEAKTHSLKSFNGLVKSQCVKQAKPVHWAQMQVYMLGKGIDRALYYAVCKDDDRIYTERVRLDKEAALALVERGRRIALSARMPEPIPRAAPDWYECRYCPGHSFCHSSRITKEVNCRTCAHSTATENSEWVCELHGGHAIPVEFQREGCEAHVLHPDLVPWNLDSELSTKEEAVYIIDGKPVRNGTADATVFASREIIASPEMCANPDDVIKTFRAKFDARIDKTCD